MAFSFKNFRILILLLILLAVAGETTLSALRTTSWDKPLWVVVYPINGDDSETSRRVIDKLTVEDFKEIETFYNKAAVNYQLKVEEPFKILLAPEIRQKPPATPAPDANPLKIGLWSLKMRWWAWRNDNYKGPTPDIQVFAEYYSQQNNTGYLSFGLKKGRISVARIFASRKYKSQNNVIIAHELLHTVGASDKYELGSLMPIYPVGYLEPDKTPLHPQRKCELMAGRIAINQSDARVPASLKQCEVGELTALEIRWIKEL